MKFFIRYQEELYHEEVQQHYFNGCCRSYAADRMQQRPGTNPRSANAYTYDHLCKLALAYCEIWSGETASLTADVSENDDGTVTIQVYESMEDHNATYAWYTVDPLTGQGVDDINGDYVDLSLCEIDLLYKDAVSWFYDEYEGFEFLDGTVCGDSVIILTRTDDSAPGYTGMLQAYVINKNRDSFIMNAMGNGPYGVVYGFSVYVISTDDLTVVFGEIPSIIFDSGAASAEVDVMLIDGTIERREFVEDGTYLIALEGNQIVSDVTFLGGGQNITYSDYFAQDIMSGTAFWSQNE